jgi:hypothetical protein
VRAHRRAALRFFDPRYLDRRRLTISTTCTLPESYGWSSGWLKLGQGPAITVNAPHRS